MLMGQVGRVRAHGTNNPRTDRCAVGQAGPTAATATPRMGRPPKDHRLIVEAIVWLDRTGAPWRDLPSQFGPWETVASRFTAGAARASGTGSWPRCRPTRTPAASWTGCCTLWTGRWCGPTSTLPVPGGGRPRPTWTRGLWSILTSRAVGIGRRWAAAAAATPPSCTFGSKVGQADGDPGHRRAAPRGADAAQADGGRGGQADGSGPAADQAGRVGKAAYRQRNHVERTVNRLKGWRRVATRYEKRELNYLAMVTIAAIVLLWLE
jgi:transposase